MRIKPIDIARKLKISTSALRHYESWGILPPIERSANGYRMYTEEHVAYFECIRAMHPGFGFALTSDVLRKLIVQDINAALWMVNERQASLHQDKMIAEKTIQLLESTEFIEDRVSDIKPRMTIGQVSRETGIPSSAIRHWDKMGILQIPRDPDNGYRLLSDSHLRKILLIRTLKSAVWSLDVISEVLSELDDNNYEQARRVARDSLKYLDRIVQNQLRGMHSLYLLCSKLKLT
ncbi:MerR family transcriptional regulator [Cohnella lupini]|uniref:DNA-binding transcriptional MerR regulator n=1 Tax=Cohnella lupini TaxID=1294267 RepID=A0A3D9IXK0_9BACL|nr:MerR family transcriptional regulator [Cohnella lupini]RED66239.1 DNA-binding transcriptional MerR regulator [Cohnella lupini]